MKRIVRKTVSPAGVVSVGVAISGLALIFIFGLGDTGRVLGETNTINWTVDGTGDSLIVKDSDGKIIEGRRITPIKKPTGISPVGSGSESQSAAKDAIDAAVKDGLIAAGIQTEGLTPEQIVYLPAVQYLDFDSDGLSNAEEIRLGTDPYGSDSDRDGTGDGMEIQSGYDPKKFSPGDGRDAVVREDVRSVIERETAVIASGGIPQKKEDARYRVDGAMLVKGAPEATEKIRFTGKALPNAFVTLYIYSTPVIVVVKADINGDWSYDLSTELENGEHEAFVAVTDTTGKISSYGSGIGFVKTAEAITVRPLAEAATTVSGNQSPLERSQAEYFFAAFIAILFFSGAALIVVNRRSS